MKKKEEILKMANLKSTYLSKSLNNEEQNENAVFFGTGLASTSAPSLGFGIDILSTILTALEVKRILGAKYALHLISTTGYNISQTTRDELIEKQCSIINTITSNLGISNEYKVICSNSFVNTQRFKEIYKEVANKLQIFNQLENFERFGSYTILQTAICKYLYVTENALVKIGWTLKDCEREEYVSESKVQELIELGHLNESYFDDIYRYTYPEDICSYIYTPPAIGLDGRSSPPYTVTENDNRPLIDEDVSKYYYRYMDQMKNSRDTRKKLKRSIENLRNTIVGPYERLFGKIIINSEDENILTLMKVANIQKTVLEKRIIGINSEILNKVKEDVIDISVNRGGR